MASGDSDDSETKTDGDEPKDTGADESDDSAESTGDADDDAAAKAKAKDDDDEPEEAKDDDSTDDDAPSKAAAPKAKAAAERRRFPVFWTLLLVALVTIYGIYGSRADIRVCVGKKGVHDFALTDSDTARTDENRWDFPRCERGLNIGMRSVFDEQVKEVTARACRGATVLRHKGEGKDCVEGKKGWQHHIKADFIWPWDERYYKRLLWFAFD